MKYYEDMSIKDLCQLRSDIQALIDKKYENLPPKRAIAKKDIYYIAGYLRDKYFIEDTLKLDLIIKAGTELSFSHQEFCWKCLPENSYSVQNFPVEIEFCDGFEIIGDN